MRKGVLLCALLILLLLPAITITAHAHPGRTDGNGGHTDHSTGDYHYHHGYPAHYHYDMNGDGIPDCPYEFKDQTNHSSGNNSTLTPSNGNTTQTVTTPIYASIQTKVENVDYTYNYIVILFTFVVLIFAMCIGCGKDDQDEDYHGKNWIPGQAIYIISILIVYGVLFAIMIDDKWSLEFRTITLKKMLGAILGGCIYGGLVAYSAMIISSGVGLVLCKVVRCQIADRLHASWWLSLPLGYLYIVSWHIFD